MGGVTVSMAVAELLLYVAVIVTEVFALTLPGEIVNVAEVAPAGNVTL
jgi:hypothetical protein